MPDFNKELNYAMQNFGASLNGYTKHEIQQATNVVINRMEDEQQFVNGSGLIALIKAQIEYNKCQMKAKRGNRFEPEFGGGGGKSKSRKRRQTRRRRQKKSRRNGKR
jgi:hypothetical protein